MNIKDILNEFYDQANNDLNALQSLLFHLHGLNFDGFKCPENTSIRLSKRRNGRGYIVTEFGGGLPQYNKPHDFKGVIFEHTKTLSKDAILSEQIRLIELCLGVSINLEHKKISIDAKSQKISNTHKTKSNPENIASYEYICGKWDSPAGKAAAIFLNKKTGAKTELLQKYDIRPILAMDIISDAKEKTRVNFPENNFAFGYFVGDNAKKRQPNSEYKHHQIKGKTPYIFGLHQLPEKGDTLFICAGETDTITINTHCQNKNIYAICLMSENDTTTLTPEIVENLKSRFLRIYVLFDTDSTGIKYSKILSEKFDFIWCDTAFLIKCLSTIDNEFSKCKDVADVFGIGINSEDGSDRVQTLIKLSVDTSTKIKQYEDDNFSLKIEYAKRIYFEQYLSEESPNYIISPIIFIALCIKENKKLIIQSPAGTGKSQLIKALVKKNIFLSMTGKDRLIIAEPTTTIAAQLHSDFLADGLSAALIVGSVQGFDLEEARSANIIITTFDSCSKLDTQNAYFVVDEFHQMVTDFSYRENAMHTMIDAIRASEFVLMLSATPNYFFCSNLHELFNFSILICCPQKTNKIYLEIIKHSTPKKHLISTIAKQKTETGTIGVKIDNNTILNGFRKYVDLQGFISDHLTSQNKKRKDENTNYKGIISEGVTPDKLDFLFFTTLLEAGVSLKFSMPILAILDVKSWSKIIQLSTRPRYNATTGINQIVTVQLYFSKGKKKIEAPLYGKNATSIFDSIYKDASETCAKINAQGHGNIKFDVSTDIQILIRTTASGIWEPDILSILHEVYKAETAATDTDTLIKRIRRFDERFSFISERDSSEAAATDAISAYNDAQAEQSANVAAFINFLQSCDTTELEKTANVVLSQIPNQNLKDDLRRLLQLPTTNKTEQIKFVATNPIIIEPSNGAQRVIKDIAFYMKAKSKITLIEACQIVINKERKEIRRDKDIHEYKSRQRVYKTEKRTGVEALHPSDKINIACDNNIVKVVGQLYKDANRGRKSGFTPQELADIVNKILKSNNQKILPIKSAIIYLQRLYDLEQKHAKNDENKTIRIYTILGRASLSKGVK